MFPNSEPSDQQFPVRLTLAQRIVVAGISPTLSDRLRLDEPNQRVVSLTLDELKVISKGVVPAIRHADTGMKRASLRLVLDITRKAIEHFQGIGVIPAKERLYQFKITLKGIRPLIWRRIQVRDSTLDKFHERIQTAMGWTNSHLHHFQINETLYGDPLLLDENFVEMNYKNSRETVLSRILPKNGKRFEYEYDFGDSWWHDVLFEGCLKVEADQRFTRCVWKVSERARLMTWAGPRVTRSSCMYLPTPEMNNTSSSWGGSAGRSTPRTSIPRKRPRECGGDCLIGARCTEVSCPSRCRGNNDGRSARPTCFPR